MARVEIANLKGPKGDTGPRGLPGMDAAPTDEAVAGYAGAGSDSATGRALLGNFLGQVTNNRPVPYPDNPANGSVAVPRMSEVMVSLPDVPGRPHVAFPTMVRTPSGLIVVARAAAAHNSLDGRLAMYRSEDGRSWTPPEILSGPTGIPGAIDQRDPALSLLSDGSVLLSWYDAGTKRSYYSRSVDDGATWDTPAAFPFVWADTQFVTSRIVEVGSVWVAAAYGRETAGTPYSVAVIRSADRGSTWSVPIAVGSGVEPVIQGLSGTALLMLIRTDDGWTMKATSANGGESWTTPAKAFMGAGRPDLFRFDSGVLVSAYRSGESAMRGLTASRNTGLQLRASRDNGETWTRAVDALIWRTTTYAAMSELRQNQAVTVIGVQEAETSSALVAAYVSDGSGVTPLGPVASGLAPRPGIVTQGLRLRKSSDQSVAGANAWVNVTFNAVVADMWNGFAFSPDGAAFTVNESGYYHVFWRVQWGDTGQGAVRLVGESSGSRLYETDTSGDSSSRRSTLSAPAYLTEGEWYRLQVNFNRTGVVVRSGSQPENTYLEVVKLKPIA